MNKAARLQDLIVEWIFTIFLVVIFGILGVKEILQSSGNIQKGFIDCVNIGTCFYALLVLAQADEKIARTISKKFKVKDMEYDVKHWKIIINLFLLVFTIAFAGVYILLPINGLNTNSFSLWALGLNIYIIWCSHYNKK